MDPAKPVNQDSSIVFCRGSFVLTIGCNQGAVFEHMLWLPCILGELRDMGQPEYVFSDMRSMSTFAALAVT